MNSKIIVALDFATTQQALDLATRLEPQQCKLKVGKELFTRGGPQIVTTLVEMGFDVFLDLKFHDIPNTVAKACLAAAELGVWMINIHASGGRNMMLAARESIDQYSANKDAQKPLLIAVTVLTSMTNSDLIDIGIVTDPETQVNRLAVLAQQCGMDGVVCSPLEIASLRGQLGASFKLVTPGVRPVGANQDDQNRVMTPDAAIKEGADYLVIGRPIYQSNDPLQAVADINVNLSTVLK